MYVSLYIQILYIFVSNNRHSVSKILSIKLQKLNLFYTEVADRRGPVVENKPI